MKRYQIGEVSKILGIGIDTLRYYEKLGLLPPVFRTGNGIRRYDEQDIARLLFIVRAKAMNFTLSEIATLLALRDAAQPARDDVRALALRKLDEIETRLQELTILRQELRLMIEQCRGSEQGCPIIDKIDSSD